MPFPIQEAALPLGLAGQDVIGQARTGTGKTYAFGVAMLQRLPLRASTAPRGLVVTPTRELALQVASDLETAGNPVGARVLTVFGGRAYEPQIEGLRAGVDIVVGTPGRLLDLSRQRHLDLSRISVLVLDEADRMLDLGFLPDVERLLELTPDDRQTMLFSATMPGEIVTLSRRYLRRPTHVRAERAGESAVVPSTAQHAFRTHPLDKPEMLARVLQAKDRGRTMVFCHTKRDVDRLASDLAERGFATTVVHGDVGQGQREKALRSFRAGQADVLVATDVAARGLDVEGVTHVVNYACPADDNEYLHRIGRTSRAGREGTAVTFVDWGDVGRWRVIDDALDLSLPEPAETYSTSEHLYDELGIPPDAAGHTRQSQGRQSGRRRPARRRQGLQEQASDRGSDRPARKRARRRSRTRAGRPVTHEGDSQAAEAGSAADRGQPAERAPTARHSSGGQTASRGGDQTGSQAGDRPLRRRRRSRGRSRGGGREGGGNADS